MTIGEIEKTFTEQLSALYGKDEARSLSWLSINHICKINRIDFLSRKNETLSLPDETSLLQILEELKTGKPLQYVLGETEFYGLPFKVNPSVLIPRPETEELVDWILKEIRSKQKQPDKGLKILDIGTGSGCIPIALKKNLPEAEVWAIDISPEALETAGKNAALNQTDVRFFQADILNLDQKEILNTKYSILVSNPPYVTMAEKEQMHANVLEHEPHTALFVPDQDPLIFYQAIANFAQKHLEKDGSLFFEINENLGAQTLELLKYKGFNHCELRKDLRGKERMIKASFQAIF